MTTVGVIGGGQLGRMLAVAGMPLGITCIGLEPSAPSCMRDVAEVITGEYHDRNALTELARRCDVITVELEHVDCEALEWISARVPVLPRPGAIGITQDRLIEKQFVRDRCGLRTADFGAHVTPPAIVKTRRGGFDGRNQVFAANGDELERATKMLTQPIVESLVSFERELSIIAARARDGAVAMYPLVDNQHENLILRASRAPAVVSEQTNAEAARIASVILTELDYVGVLAIELFETADGLVVNEMAPRVHNSGHWTIDGAVTSQFEQHLRAVCGLPLGDPSPIGLSAMVNIISTRPDTAAVLAVKGAHLHLYGKAERPNRKLGHVTVTATTPDDLEDRLARLRVLIP